MHFRKLSYAAAAVILFALSVLPLAAGAEVLDRVVAFIDDDVITLRELKERYEEARKHDEKATEEGVLDAMINRMLLMREARALGMEGPDEAVLEEYVDLRVRAFIKPSEKDMMDYYEENADMFEDRDFDSLKEDIAGLLQEKEVNRKLKRHIDDLKARTHIKVFFP